MSVGVVANEVAMVYPQNSVGGESFFQFFFYFILTERLVAVGGHQASRCGEHGAFAVALYRTAFEHEVIAVDVFSIHHTGIKQGAVDTIIKRGLEFLSPSIKLEVEQTMTRKRTLLLAIYESDESVVARPCVVGVAFHVSDTWGVGQ